MTSILIWLAGIIAICILTSDVKAQFFRVGNSRFKFFSVFRFVRSETIFLSEFGFSSNPRYSN